MVAFFVVCLVGSLQSGASAFESEHVRKFNNSCLSHTSRDSVTYFCGDVEKRSMILKRFVP